MASKVAKRDRKQEELDKLVENKRYRFKEALGSDWPEEDIETLANRNDVSPWDLENLLKQGCPPRTAVKILI